VARSIRAPGRQALKASGLAWISTTGSAIFAPRLCRLSIQNRKSGSALIGQ
jgi:hypothetical protein